MNAERTTKIGLSGFDWKVIALLFMMLDHLHSYLGLFPEWIALLPRFVAAYGVAVCFTSEIRLYLVK